MGEKFKKLKEENKILVMLAFFSISIGLWTNFKQLWLQDNNLEVEKISQILSVSGLFCVIALILFAKKVSLKNIQSNYYCIAGKSYNLNYTSNTKSYPKQK